MLGQCALGVVACWTAFVGAAPAAIAAQRALSVDDLAKISAVSEPQPSPDGQWVAYLVKRVDLEADERRAQLWRVSWDGRERLPLTREADSVSAPLWSPDGRYLSFLAERTQGEKKNGMQLWALDLRGGEAQPLTSVHGELFDYAWSPDGERLALVMRPETEAARKEREGGKAVPQPYVIDRFLFKDDSDGYLHAGLPLTRIFLYEIATKTLTALTAEARFEERSPVWSPDGSQIAFVSNRDEQWDRTINTDVWVIESRAGATPRRLTTFPGSDTDPEWSPDGREIVYLQGPEPKFSYYGPGQLAVVSVAGGAVRYPARELDRDVSGARFSEDGRYIDFLVEDNRESYLARVAARGGKVQRRIQGQRVVQDHGAAAGHTVVLSSHDTAPAEIFALEGGALRPLTTHNEAWLKEIRLAPSEDFELAAADGTRVYGLLTKPAGSAAEGGGKAPPWSLLLWIHGGPYGQDQHGFDFERQLFATQGYAVLQINYRGSSGRGTEFGHGIFADWGNKDLTDLLDAVNRVIDLGIADPQRLMVGGWSNGGIMTDYVIARDPRFKVAISGAGYGNLIPYYGSDRYTFIYDNELGHPWAEKDRWLRLSYPLFEADKIRTPTLFVGGLLDFNVPIIGGEQMYQALKSLNVPTQLVIYPDEHHVISRPSFQLDLLRRYLAWYARHLATS